MVTFDIQYAINEYLDAGKACAQGNCSCFAARMSCMTYCRCAGSQDECHNQLTKKYDDDTSDD